MQQNGKDDWKKILKVFRELKDKGSMLEYTVLEEIRTAGNKNLIVHRNFDLKLIFLCGNKFS